MNQEIMNNFKIDNTCDYDENGLALNFKGNVPYTGVFFETSRREFTVAVTSTLGASSRRYKSKSYNISSHTCALEAAFYYKSFISNFAENVKRLDVMGQYHWVPLVETPIFKYDSYAESLESYILEFCRTSKTETALVSMISKLNPYKGENIDELPVSLYTISIPRTFDAYCEVMDIDASMVSPGIKSRLSMYQNANLSIRELCGIFTSLIN